jgi:hypothetical protein
MIICVVKCALSPSRESARDGTKCGPPGYTEVLQGVQNPGNWNVGHVVLAQKKAHILLVTINKQGKADEHKYMDHWIDDSHFHWQSGPLHLPRPGALPISPG